MSVRLVGETRLGKRVVFGLVSALVVALVVGFLAGGLSGDVSPVYAINCNHAVNFACNGGTTTSALEVSHHTSPSYLGTSTVVQPDDGETWAITAQWCAPLGGPEVAETAYATVDWDGSSWSVSSVTTTTNIVGVSICDGDTCDAGGGAVHSWNYKLIVDVNDPHGATNLNLAKVTYTTTSVDDGDLVLDPTETHGDCDLGASVSPTSQTFTATDFAIFWSSDRCTFGCSVTGGSVTLLYD